MITVYKCDECGKSFMIKDDCIKHERMHHFIEEYKKTHKPKFSVGDVIIVNRDGAQHLRSIQNVKCEFDQEKERLFWKYKIGYDAMFHSEYVDEDLDNIKLVMTKDDIEEDLIPKLNEVFKKYNENFSVLLDDIDGFRFYLDFDGKNK